MKKIKVACISIGTALLLAALFFVLFNLNQDRKSGETAQSILAELKEDIMENSSEEDIENSVNDDLYSEYESSEAAEPYADIDGNTYIGVIAIPSLGIELPVMNEWSYPSLKISPCRYKGTAADNDLIIAAHNYKSHFGRINELSGGEEIIFTDAAGKLYRYEVTLVDNIRGTDIEAMEFDSSEDWDITLFTCTLSGQSRVTVRTVRVE